MVAAVPEPGSPFEPLEYILESGTDFYRVASNSRDVDAFNAGLGGRTRFAFFGSTTRAVTVDSPAVPILYGAQSIEAAICESILHDIPQTGGLLRPNAYSDKIGARLVTGRDLRLASFMGLGLKHLHIEQAQLIDTPASSYKQTVAWAHAAYVAGFDGAVWMSRRCNSDRAYVLFGDRVGPADLAIDPGFGQVYCAGPDLDWLIRFCAPLHIDVLVHS